MYRFHNTPPTLGDHFQNVLHPIFHAERYAAGLMVGLLILFAVAYVLLVSLGTASLVWVVLRPARRTMGKALAIGCPVVPDDLGMTGEEVTFNLADHTTSPGFIVNGHKPDGPVAIVLHGYTDSRFGALYRAELLAPFVSHTVVFDLPAHGDSQATIATFGQREPADVLSVIHGLPPEVRYLSQADDEEKVERPVVLFGYSMGGHIAVRVAAEHHAFVGVIAVSPYRHWDDGLRCQLKRRGLPLWPLVWLAGIVVSSVWRTRLGQIDRAKDAELLQCPLLVLHGSADDVCPLESGQAIADAAPDGSIYVVDNGTHNHLLAEDYNGIVAELGRFFDGLSPITPDRESVSK